MAWILLGIGLVLAVEGLVLALLPGRLDDILEALNNIPLDTRRLLGLAALAGGVFLVWIARSLGI